MTDELFDPASGEVNHEVGDRVRARWAIRDSGLDGNHKLILYTLIEAARLDKDRGAYVCWPSLETLALWCGMGIATLIRNMRWLRESGLVVVEQRPNESSLYYINLLEIEALPKAVKNGKPRSRGVHRRDG